MNLGHGEQRRQLRPSGTMATVNDTSAIGPESRPVSFRATGATAIGLIAGAAADAVFGDPKRHHPVAWFGSWTLWLEKHLYQDSIGRGALFTAIALAPVAAIGLAADRLTRNHPLARTALTATATWAVLGGHSLASEGNQMADELADDDIAAARDRLTHLCSRNPENLDAAELARGTVESLAENTSDAVVCSLFWGSAAGIPGLLLHRAINTLDAMVGYHNPRYENFGKASAIVDDVAAYIPARLSGAISSALAPTIGGSAQNAWRVMMRDARNHPSPNGGWCEAAWAGALGTHLGGASDYHGRIEERPRLGDPDTPSPDVRTIKRASRLVGAVTAASAVLAAMGSVVVGAIRAGRSRRWVALRSRI